MSRLLHARRLITGSDLGTPDEGWIRVEDGRITDVGHGAPPGHPDVSIEDGWLVPAYVDIHCHGGGGGDFTSADAASIRTAATFHAEHGTGSLLASLVTAPVDALCDQLDAVADVVEAGDTIVRGSHLEGPFLSAARCGAQNPAHLAEPDVDAFARLVEAARGTLRMITLAPELTGSAALLDAALAAGVVVAVGHTDGTYEQCTAAFDAGASVATHLFNGMRPLHHREPGPVGASLDAGAWVELINDGVHLHPATLRTVLAARPDRAVLVTDAIAAAGLPDGDHVLGGLAVSVAGGAARLTDSGSLAGSTLTMDDAVRRAVEARVPVPLAVAAASAHPAAATGLRDRGVIAPGYAADLLHLGEDLRVRRVGLG
ncbi:N-acetylglucosamine-6-phosphate deacetylase [Luteipulveratus flavus]|uniref:N-acetylglucosamine-6-phosphate deacetylase n=1 Tax=Luteipulveratus flavus TaxID=3031728 RepID=A0ABT6C6K8_9MICO|nr:N-acetylglucosamine-6-phosphate deacetylase [Luteipulveratus sp. YIM 133296]MDF8264571.1 N-acetylglucosamine-6-phosphate deacetylase [Luteipulveratus sp. YIM 133296]